ncbi:PilW family protein [Stenotrophomonas mori]|uniref:Pilus assembly protein n=1 Tax=Stenotrophomonas mori TaxID=2871096 RepID=A0ABT0SGQ4_9GAMM|nr:hypothetical protein [Stenotrophomonas mori]MCL7714510.1 hypothetical protein [Stenotrophomonas mori]
MPRPRRGQCGQSLISMMVGLVISLITIAAMLVLYKTMVTVSSDASRAALRDGQMAAGLLAAQLDLQAAGFGVEPAPGLDDRIALSDAGRQVVWRYLQDGASACAGLRVETAGLYRLPPKSCDSVAAVDWDTNERMPMALMPKNPDGSLFELAGERGGMSLAGGHVFSLERAACLPYMQQDAATLPAVQRVSLKRVDGSGEPLFSVCLPNLAAAAVPS